MAGISYFSCIVNIAIDINFDMIQMAQVCIFFLFYNIIAIVFSWLPLCWSSLSLRFSMGHSIVYFVFHSAFLAYNEILHDENKIHLRVQIPALFHSAHPLSISIQSAMQFSIAFHRLRECECECDVNTLRCFFLPLADW